MFSRIQTRHYRCLKVIDQPLAPFHALVGPNASGKSTFLDVIEILGDLMRNRGDVLETTAKRSANFENLLWMGEGTSFQIALEAAIPDKIRRRMAEDKQRFLNVRYELEIGLNPHDNAVGLDSETLWLVESSGSSPNGRQTYFPMVRDDTGSILMSSGKSRRVAIKKKAGGNDNYYTEGRSSYNPSFKLGRDKSALANLPADRDAFPVSMWFRDQLEAGVQALMLNSQKIRQPSPPGLGRKFDPAGANLPWVIEDLRKEADSFQAWLDHVRTALEDVVDIRTVERPEDKHRYLMIEYANGAVVPSWLVSDGTLRLLALTIPAYLNDLTGTFLIEEPENGIHPGAIETVVQSLSSMYHCQVLMATHSPVALNMLKPEEVLCFAKDASGATDIVSGDRHPKLAEWKQGEPDFGTLFASGILS